MKWLFDLFKNKKKSIEVIESEIKDIYSTCKVVYESNIKMKRIIDNNEYSSYPMLPIMNQDQRIYMDDYEYALDRLNRNEDLFNSLIEEQIELEIELGNDYDTLHKMELI